MEYLKSLEWVDYYFFSIIDPRRLAGLLKREEGKPFLVGYITVAAVAAINIITFSLIGKETSYFYNKITYGWISSFLVSVLIIIIYAALIDFFCQLRGKPGSIKTIVNLLNISLFPHAFLLPIFFIFKVAQFAPIFFLILSIFGLTAWQALIIILGLSETHQMEFSEALVAFLFPVLMIGVIAFFIFILMIINLISFISII